jgi:hypothetical protein
MKTNELKTDYWKYVQKEQKPIIHYDEIVDTLFLYFTQKEEDTIVSHYVDEFVSFLFRRSDNQVIGMRIEYFKEVFIPKVAEQKVWKLSSTGKELVGMRDLSFRFGVVDKPIPTPRLRIRQYTIPRPLEKNIQLEPVFS